MRDGDGASVSDSEPPLPRLSNPPAGHPLFTTQYDTFDELMEDLNDYAARAYFLVIKRSSSNRVEGFGYTRVELACQRGKVRAFEAHSRSVSTSKRGCEWKAVAKVVKKYGRK